jgi:transcriptional regulator with XRE-family HTH domain
MESGWRDRLAAHLKASGKSMRQVSLASGNGPGYLHSILKDGKEPTIDNLASVCDAAEVSLLFVLFGLDVSREDERILQLLRDHPGSREGILQILSARQER